MRLALAAFGLLVLVGCQGKDAYLGSMRVGYQCGARCARDPGAPEDSGEWFFNPDAMLGSAPQIVYPLSGSVHPKDLRQLTIQFRRGRSDFTLFRVRFATPDARVAYDFFTPCLAVQGDGCRYLLDGGVWDAAREELRGKPAVLTVTGSTGREGVIRSSEPLPISVTESALQNKGFYYWTSVPQYSGVPGDQDTGIFRLPFGADRAQPFIMPNSPTNDRQCGACHSVSQDGSTIAFTARNNDGGEDQRSGVLITARTARPDEHFIQPAADATYDTSMMALSSDGKRVLVTYDDKLVLRNATEDPASGLMPGDELATVDAAALAGKIAYFPEFSPTDDAVVLTLSDTPDSAIAVQSGDIAVIDVNLATSEFGAPKPIVLGTESEFHFYPTWSPDGKFVAFATAPRYDAAGNPNKSYDQKLARLRLVAREGGTPVELARATHELEKWSTFPKFAPFLQSENGQGGLMFLTFNSKINYGLVLDNDSMTEPKPQLWMSAIDVTKLPQDPSSAPIWLPFQDAGQSSHLGIWTREVKCRTDVGTGRACDIGQECDQLTNTCQVIVK